MEAKISRIEARLFVDKQMKGETSVTKNKSDIYRALEPGTGFEPVYSRSAADRLNRSATPAPLS